MGQISKKWLYLLIIIPLFISGYVSFAILNKNRSQNNMPTIGQFQGNDKPINSPTVTPPFGMPGRDAEETDREIYLQKILAEAKAVNSFDIANCKPNPAVIKVTTNKQFTVTNSGNKPEEIEITEDMKYTIPAKGKIVLVAEFGKGSGAYDYRCNQSSVPVGVIVVANPQ